MKIQDYLKLKNKFEDKSFETTYGALDKMLYYASFVGNAASIFFAFFFLNQILLRATSEFGGRGLIIGVASVVFLTGFEFLKRFILKNLSLAAIQIKRLNAEVLYNLSFATIILLGSFYLSLSGAKIFADKREVVEQHKTMEISTQIDSVKAIFDSDLKYKINERDGLIKNRDTYSNKMADGEAYTARLKEYNNLIEKANEEIKRADAEIATLKKERNDAIDNIKTEISASTDIKVKQIFKNQMAFILISSFIEILILIGIVFHCFFITRIYKEFNNDVKNTRKYKMYESYIELLAVLYEHNTADSENIFSDSNNRITRMPSFHTGIRRKYGDQAIAKFLEICKSLNIIHIDGTNVTSMTFEEAKKTLLDRFT